MSEPNGPHEPQQAGPDEVGLDAALAVLEGSLAEVEGRLQEGDEATAALRRQQLEALSLLAWALPAEPASTQGRQRLLGRLMGDETVMVVRPASERATTPGAAPAASPFGVLDPPAPPDPVVVGGARATAARGPGAGAGATPAAAGARRGVAPAVPLRPVRSYRWALPLAAVFALAALGVGFHDWRVTQELGRAEQQLAAVQQERQQLAARLQGFEGEAQSAALEGKASELEAQLAMLTSPGTLVCALKPSPGSSARRAGGMLYVADDHQHWYLRARNLPAPGDGRAYQLWFLVGNDPVHAGTFEMQGDEAVMSSPTMPAGTTAALVTIEAAGVATARPQGPVVLYGRDMKPLAS